MSFLVVLRNPFERVGVGLTPESRRVLVGIDAVAICTPDA
jgi:hypothetical protein